MCKLLDRNKQSLKVSGTLLLILSTFHHLSQSVTKPMLCFMIQDAQHREAMVSLHTADRSSLMSEIHQLRGQLEQLQQGETV